MHPAPAHPRTRIASSALLLAFLLAGSALTIPSPTSAEPPDATSDSPDGVGLGGIAASFGLTPPVRVGFCEEHPQDGTLGVTLVDRAGRELDCGLEVGCGAGITDGRRPSSRPRPVFVGATRVDRPAARRLPLWGTEERALIRLLTLAIADSISDAQNDLLLKGARAGLLSDPGGFGLLRLIGSVERRRRMLAALDAGDPAPVADAEGYFGLGGVLAVRRIDVDRSKHLCSITVADARGHRLTASPGCSDAKGIEGAWSVSVAGHPGRFYVPLGGYEERYLLTLLSAAIRATEGRELPVEATARDGDSAPDAAALKAAIKTVQFRISRIREADRLD